MTVARDTVAGGPAFAMIAAAVSVVVSVMVKCSTEKLPDFTLVARQQKAVDCPRTAISGTRRRSQGMTLDGHQAIRATQLAQTAWATWAAISRSVRS